MELGSITSVELVLGATKDVGLRWAWTLSHQVCGAVWNPLREACKSHCMNREGTADLAVESQGVGGVRAVGCQLRNAPCVELGGAASQEPWSPDDSIQSSRCRL